MPWRILDGNGRIQSGNSFTNSRKIHTLVASHATVSRNLGIDVGSGLDVGSFVFDVVVGLALLEFVFGQDFADMDDEALANEPSGDDDRGHKEKDEHDSSGGCHFELILLG